MISTEWTTHWYTAALALLLIAVFGQAQATEQPGIAAYVSDEFNPSQGELFDIPVQIPRSGNVKVVIYTSDGDTVRELDAGLKRKAGTYSVRWDGKDSEGAIVPDEAYIPVVELLTAGTDRLVYDPRQHSGGEEVQLSSKTQFHPGFLRFPLDRPSRVLVRAGIRSGPMMHTVLHWQARGKGLNRVDWDGFNRSRTVNLLNYYRSDLAVVAVGFYLPDHSILTSGNPKLDYLDWRRKKGWKNTPPDLSDAAFERDGRRISRNYHLPRYIDIQPGVELSVVTKARRNSQGMPIITGPVLLRADIPVEDRRAMQQSLYEMSFFLDGKFLTEEEQGYAPLTWRWDPAGTPPGVHILTVNASGLHGQVGVHSLLVEVPEKQGSRKKEAGSQ